jgi:hypothetical protein
MSATLAPAGPAAPAVPRRSAASALAVARLHATRRNLTFAAPAFCVLVTAAISLIVYLVLIRTGATNSPGYDPQWNMAMAYALPGFFGYLGTTMVATSFPFALALGATRRAFVAGTLLTYLMIAAYTAAMFTVMLGLERATGHWFAGIHVFDTHVLGGGDPLRCAAIGFLGSLTVFAISAAFASAWTRFRGKGPAGIGLGIVLVLGMTAVAIGPRLGQVFAGFRLWWLAVAAVVVIAVALGGMYLFLRRASVR